MFRPDLVPLLAILLLLGGCATGEPLVQKDISTMVNEQGRERTYDLAWQDIRRFEGALTRDESVDYAAQALTIFSRMNRLAAGTAGDLSDAVSRDTLEEAEQDASQLSCPQIGQILQENAALIRKSFDSGEFDSAQFHALRALGVSRAFEASCQ